MKIKIALISVFFALMNNGAFAACDSACYDYSDLVGCSQTQGVMVDGACVGTCSGICNMHYTAETTTMYDSCGNAVTITLCKQDNECSNDSDCPDPTQWIDGPNNTKTRTVYVCQSYLCQEEYETACADSGSDTKGYYYYQ